MRRRIGWKCLVWVAVWGLFTAFPLRTPAEAAKEVNLRLSYLVFALHAPYFLALEKGWFQEAGLQVKIHPGRGSSEAVKLVGAGNEEFATADVGAILPGVGRGVPVISVLGPNQVNSMCLIATEASGISQPGDLKGKRMGLFVGSTTAYMTKALLKRYNVPETDLRLITVKPGSDTPLFLRGELDSIVTYLTNEVVMWRIKHPQFKFRVWSMKDLGLDIPGDALITSKKFLEGNRAAVQGFVQASARAWGYAVENPKEGVAAMVKHAKDLDPAVELAKLQAAIDMGSIVNDDTKKHGIGWQSERKWRNLLQVYLTEEVIKTPVKLSDLFTNEFLPKK